MTAEESALQKFQDEPFFEVLIQSVSKKAAQYAYAKLRTGKTLGAGNAVDCIIREQALRTIKGLDVR